MDLASARQHAYIGVSSLLERVKDANGFLLAGTELIVDPQDAILKTYVIKVHKSDMLVLLVQKTTGAEYILAITLDRSRSLLQCSQQEKLMFKQQCIHYQFPDPTTLQVVVFYSDSMSVMSWE